MLLVTLRKRGQSEAAHERTSLRFTVSPVKHGTTSTVRALMEKQAMRTGAESPSQQSVSTVVVGASSLRDTLKRGSEASGLHVSQVGFLAAVLANCPIAAATRWLPKGNARHIYGTVTTLSLLALAYGRDVQQFVYAGALVYFFMRVFPGDCGYLTWATIFTYQVYL